MQPLTTAELFKLKLYKYLRREHADAMLTKGELRLGTLYDFRRNPNPEIGDAGEATLQISTTPSGPYTKDEELPSPIRHVIGGLTGNNIQLSFEDITFKTHHDAPDAYVYCMTDEPNKKTLRKFGYDACIEISNLPIFIELIMRGLAVSEKIINIRYQLGKCNYEGRVSTDDILSEIYLRKEAKHLHQKEWRLILSSTGNSAKLKPLNISNYLIPSLIKEIKL
jgi:hypothetical protein